MNDARILILLCGIVMIVKAYMRSLNFTENQDYTVPISYQSSALLDATTFRDCRSVDLTDDALEEASESFIFRLTLSTGPFDVIGNFQVTVPQTEVIILDDDSQGRPYIKLVK